MTIFIKFLQDFFPSLSPLSLFPPPFFSITSDFDKIFFILISIGYNLIALPFLFDKIFTSNYILTF